MIHRDTGQCPGCEVATVRRTGAVVRTVAVSGHVLATADCEDETEARHVARLAAAAHGARLEE